MKQRLALLKDALRVLAAPPESQLDHLATLGLPGAVDELALEFDDTASAAADMLEGYFMRARMKYLGQASGAIQLF